MKIAAVVVVFNGQDMIRQAIENVYRQCERVLVLCDPAPWHAEEKYPPDRTSLILKEMEDSGLFPKMIVRRQHFANEIQARNYGLNFVRLEWREITHVLVHDYDEAYGPGALDEILNFVELYSASDLQIFYIGRETYWKTLDWRIWPREPYKPLIVHSADWKLGEYWDGKRTHREIGERGKALIPESVALQHHASWVRASDSKIKEKIETFMHRGEIVPGWYENVWLQWTPSMRNIHPTSPSCYEQAIPSDPSLMPIEWHSLSQFWKGPVHAEAHA